MELIIKTCVFELTNISSATENQTIKVMVVADSNAQEIKRKAIQKLKADFRKYTQSAWRITECVIQ